MNQPITDRERHLMWLMVQDDIHQYLRACTAGRLSGARKAQVHIELVDNYIAWWFQCEKHQAKQCEEKLWAVHDATRVFTDHMDEAIGFPPYDEHPDYDDLAPLFFQEFHKIAVKVLSTP